MIELGKFSLLFAFLLASASLAFIVIGLRRKDGRLIEVSYRMTKGIFVFMTLASAVLVYAFINNDFRLDYVASYSELSLPIFYKVTGLWAGQQGSLLFWGWLISLFTCILLVRDERKLNTSYLPYVLFFMNITVLFFLFLSNFVIKPFELLAQIPADGNGLNPLLQNPGMVFHPPTLYIGYVGFTVPFAYAMAAMVTGDLGDWWIKKTRVWTLVSWAFLTVGIVFGGWWAYRELGWGGVWGWDPVENSSIMPWFIATAFLHSVMVQERRNMLKVWNLSLIVITFALTIFGTFITRSGVIQSVHSFGRSPVGYVFLGFLVVVLASGFYLIVTRYDKLKEKNPKIESMLSRESTFIYNNILLFALCFATFWGTVFPLISEAVKGVRISVGPPFFNTVNSPLLLLLLGLMAICPLLGWRRTSSRIAMKNFALPSLISFAFLPVFYFAGIRDFFPVFFYVFILFVTLSIIREFYLGTRTNMRQRGIKWPSALYSLVMRNKRKYGGFLVHIGVVVMVVGLVSYGYYQFKEDFLMKPGQEVSLKDFKLKYVNLQSGRRSNYESVSALIDVSVDGTYISTIKPEKRYYATFEPSTEVAILSGPTRDLYLILSSWQRDGAITITAVINPFLSWIWYGTTLMTLGTLLAVIPSRKRKDEVVSVVEKEILLSLREAASA